MTGLTERKEKGEWKDEVGEEVASRERKMKLGIEENIRKDRK